MAPYYDHAGITICHGDCRDVLPTLSERFDACVTDPPYHLTQASRGGSVRQNDPETPYGRTRLGSAGFMGKTWDGGDVAFRPETWAPVIDVLKPGAHLLAFGGTRTNHRLACAIEDAGFDIRDMLMWLYGSGFPKSLNISKAIDKKDQATEESTLKPWGGYGTALKPAWEPIILAIKPCEGTFAQNAVAHGVAGLNIDGSRIGSEVRKNNPASATSAMRMSGVQAGYRHDNGFGPGSESSIVQGRWPANLILDEESAAMFPDAPGQLADASTNQASRRNQNVYGALKRGNHEASANRRYTEAGGTNFAALPGARRLDGGSAARFFYTAKADSRERGTGNNHPTVKPLDLMRYLCRLLAPPSGGLFLDPFAGSGTTLIACKALNIRAVGVELEEKYCEIAARRLSQDVIDFS